VLSEIDVSSRDSHAALARRVGLSRESTTSVLKKLEERRVVLGQNVIVDISQLGFTPYALYLRIDPRSRQKRDALIEYLRRLPEVYWAATLGGNYDLLVAIQARTPGEFYNSFGKLLKRFPSLCEPEVAIRVRATQFRRSYLVPKSGRAREMLTFRSQLLAPRQLDTPDSSILRILSAEPSISTSKLAEKAKVSRPTATARLEALQKSGIIQGFTSLVDCSTYGFSSYLLLLRLRRLDEAARQRLYQFAAAHPNITFFIETIGPWQVELHCELEDPKALKELLTELHRAHGELIREVSTELCFKYYEKYQFDVEAIAEGQS